MSLVIKINPTPGPTKLYPYLMTCDVPECVARLACKSREDATLKWQYHLCPWYPDMTERLERMKNSRSLFQITWSVMDERLKEFKSCQRRTAEGDTTLTARMDFLKGEMTGLAFGIRLWMQPIFADVPAVMREANRRFKGNETGNPIITPGVDFDWKPATGSQQQQQQNGTPAPVKPLAEALVIKIKKMYSMGTFTHQEIADMNKVPLNQVLAVLETESV